MTFLRRRPIQKHTENDLEAGLRRLDSPNLNGACLEGVWSLFTQLFTIISSVVADLPHRYDPFRKRLRAFAHALPRLEEGDVGALHRTRVASRRLREWLPLLELDRETARNSANGCEKSRNSSARFASWMS